MPTIEPTEINPERPKHHITIVPGEKVSICRCWKSKKFPICDGAHKEIPGQGPCVVIAAATVPEPEKEPGA
jgi:CDGSH-type Zn-finger protein